MFVYQLLQRQIPRNSRAMTAHRLRNFVAFQQTLKHYLLHLRSGSIVKKEADQGDPQSVANVAGEHLQDAQEDEQKAEKSPHRGCD
jgi:hypothetical protein